MQIVDSIKQGDYKGRVQKKINQKEFISYITDSIQGTCKKVYDKEVECIVFNAQLKNFIIQKTEGIKQARYHI